MPQALEIFNYLLALAEKYPATLLTDSNTQEAEASSKQHHDGARFRAGETLLELPTSPCISCDTAEYDIVSRPCGHDYLHKFQSRIDIIDILSETEFATLETKSSIPAISGIQRR